MTVEKLVSDEEKVSIASNFILNSPPGELNEVLHDVKVLLKNSVLLNEVTSSVLQCNKNQLTRVTVQNIPHPCVISEFNDMGNGNFLDPRSRKCFKYDHLRREASGCDDWDPDPTTDNWRVPLEKALDDYVLNHYYAGFCSVFAKKEGPVVIINACIEGHQFSPKNYWNGQWTSKWSIAIENGLAIVKGNLKIQVHFYEEGNVQLISLKEVEQNIVVSNEDQMAEDFIKVIEESESHYQKAVGNNFSSMSDTTFKALRRQLPLTKTKMEWDKVVTYGIKHELAKIPVL